jgi:signal transduction histidine kinase
MRLNIGRYSILPMRSSLRWRLPVAMAVLVVLAPATFLAIAYREVRASTRQATAARAQAAADQIADMLGTNTQARLAELRRLAAAPILRQLIETPTDDARDAAKRALGALAAPGPQVVEVWSGAGEKVASWATPAAAANLLPPGTMPQAPGVSPLRRIRGTMYGESAVEIPNDDASTDQRHGLLVVRRTVVLAPAGDFLNRLLGQGGVLSMGNKSGDVWTTLTGPADPPPINRAATGVAEYVVGDNQRHLGALADVRGTPWSIWIDFPYAVVLAPANVFLRRMIVVALGFIAISALMIWVLTVNITTPLHDLTKTAEGIAAGQYERRVAVKRTDEIGRLGAAFNAMVDALAGSHRALEERVQERTAELERAARDLRQHADDLAAVNHELEAFSYSVSHDLRAPLRHITGFATMMEETAAESLAEEPRRYLKTIVAAATRMGQLIDDLLTFSRMGRTRLSQAPVDLNELARDAQREVAADLDGRRVDWQLHDLPVVEGDRAMLRLVFVNLLSNALKYSSTRPQSEVEIGLLRQNADEAVVFVRDNGVGFDMQYADKLFGVFQRLHRSDEFEGTGIGLANVRRIVQRHGGRTWAEGRVDGGATFYFSLPLERARSL